MRSKSKGQLAPIEHSSILETARTHHLQQRTRDILRAGATTVPRTRHTIKITTKNHTPRIMTQEREKPHPKKLLLFPTARHPRGGVHRKERKNDPQKLNPHKQNPPILIHLRVKHGEGSPPRKQHKRPPEGRPRGRHRENLRTPPTQRVPQGTQPHPQWKPHPHHQAQPPAAPRKATGQEPPSKSQETHHAKRAPQASRTPSTVSPLPPAPRARHHAQRPAHPQIPLPKGEEEPLEKRREEHQPKPHHPKPRSSSQGGPCCATDPSERQQAAVPRHQHQEHRRAGRQETLSTPPLASGSTPATAHGLPAGTTPHTLDSKETLGSRCTSAANSIGAPEAGAARASESTDRAEDPAADGEVGTAGDDASRGTPTEPGPTGGAPASGRSGKSSAWNTDGSSGRGARQAAAKWPTSPHRKQERVCPW
ncbi:synapsin-1-like [Procambarus clarkii]|uniref:synapsin-1-like n=1 Tax=Procambarus clarkii TaxID=6728 RepID=UPI0037439BA1